MRLKTLLLLLAIVLLFAWRQKTEPLLYYSPAAYVTRAQDLIDRGALKYDCVRRRIQLEESVATETDKKWFAASYLKNDVATFNAQPDLYGHFFVIAGCRLMTINPHLRTVRLPFSHPVQWFGNIDYSGPGANARLRSSRGRSITLDGLDPAATEVLETRTTVGSPERVSANSVHIDFGPQPDPAIEIHNAIDKTIIEQRVKPTSHGDVRLLGQRLGEGRIAALRSGDWLHFDTGGTRPKTETFLFTGEQHPEHASVVQLRNTQRERSYEEDSETILGSVGGETRGEVLSFPRAIARALTNALQDLHDKRGEQLADSFDVQLTIDQRLQRSIDAVLREHAEATADAQTDGELFAASVTVMSGRTGEVLVAASYPAADDLTDAERISPATVKNLLVNHNLRRHPIGSAGKPFFYAAIADQHPFLTSLVVDPHGPHPNLYGGVGEVEDLQYLLPSEYKLWNHTDAPMDFESALERSCNKYTIALGTLALAVAATDHSTGGSIDDHLRHELVAWPKPGQSSGVLLDGRRLEFAPSLSTYMKGEPLPVDPNAATGAVLKPGVLERVDEAPFIEKLSEITGVATYKGLAAPNLSPEVKARALQNAYSTLAYDIRPWRPLIEKLSAGETDDVRWRIRAAFQGISPERVNLATNLITDMRREYVAMLLGGTSSQWTNVQLAEALSRLVTGREIQASFVHAINDHGSPVLPRPLPPPPPELALSRQAREHVLNGMRRVVEGKQGLAAPELGPVLADLRKTYPEADVAIFSKTGSPSVYRMSDRPASLLLRYMVEHGRLLFAKDRVTVPSRANSVVAYASLHSAARAPFVGELAKAVNVASVETKVAATPATTRRILRVIDRLQHRLHTFRFDSPARIHFDENSSSPIYVLGEHLIVNENDAFFDRSTASDSSAVYIFSLVKWHGGNEVPTPEQLTAPDSRIVTTVIYMDVGPGSRVAVELAAKLIPVLSPLLR